MRTLGPPRTSEGLNVAGDFGVTTEYRVGVGSDLRLVIVGTGDRRDTGSVSAEGSCAPSKGPREEEAP